MTITNVRPVRRPPFLLQSKIEDAIIEFFRDVFPLSPDCDSIDIKETTVDIDGRFDAYALALAIERAVDEALAED